MLSITFLLMVSIRPNVRLRTDEFATKTHNVPATVPHSNFSKRIFRVGHQLKLADIYFWSHCYETNIFFSARHQYYPKHRE